MEYCVTNQMNHRSVHNDVKKKINQGSHVNKLTGLRSRRIQCDTDRRTNYRYSCKRADSCFPEHTNRHLEIGMTVSFAGCESVLRESVLCPDIQIHSYESQ